MVDATVVATAHTAIITERTTLHRVLTTLTGAQVPNRKGAWSDWLATDAGKRYRPRKTSGDAGSSPRVHADFITQLTVVRDFDVEVSKTSFIADPEPDTVQEGAVIDTESK